MVTQCLQHGLAVDKEYGERHGLFGAMTHTERTKAFGNISEEYAA